MITVSPELKAAFGPPQGGRFIDYSVRFEAINLDAQAEAMPEAAQDTRISRLTQIVNRSDDALDFATFEPAGWPLDGSKVIPPKPNELPDAEIGLVMPDLSNENGLYAEPQVIILTTANTHDLLALSLDFGFSPAADFSLDLYDGSTLLHHAEVTDNASRRYLMRQAVNGVSRVTLTITRSAQPYRHVRLVEVAFGAILHYDKMTADALDITEVIDPLNERVPAGEARLVVDNFSRDFNLFDPASLYEYFQDRQALTARIGAQKADGIIEYVPMGRYYLQRPKLRGNLSKLELKAVGLFGVLAESTYSKGVYKTASFADFAEDIAEDAGVAVSHPASWATITMTAYVPSVTHTEALRMLAQATGTLLRVNRDDVIAFVEINEGVMQVLTPADYQIGNGFAPSDEDIINTVTVEASTLSVEAPLTELAKAEGAGTHYLKYEPSTEHSAAIDGGSIVSAEYYADNAVITIDGGTVTVSGKKIVTGKSTVTATSATGNARRYVYKVNAQSFIQVGNAQAVAAHYLSLKGAHRKSAQVQYRGYPYLETADVLAFNTGSADTQPFIVTKNALRLAGGMTGTLETRERP